MIEETWIVNLQEVLNWGEQYSSKKVKMIGDKIEF